MKESYKAHQKRTALASIAASTRQQLLAQGVSSYEADFIASRIKTADKRQDALGFTSGVVDFVKSYSKAYGSVPKLKKLKSIAADLRTALKEIEKLTKTFHPTYLEGAFSGIRGGKGFAHSIATQIELMLDSVDNPQDFKNTVIQFISENVERVVMDWNSRYFRRMIKIFAYNGNAEEFEEQGARIIIEWFDEQKIKEIQ